MKTAASTFVRLTRDDLESWLDTTEWQGKWIRKPDKAGVYQLPLSDTVAVELFTTLSKSDDVMGLGMASMKLRLMSLVTNQTLNKKAMGQSHFKRTTGWQKTWLIGIKRMKDAYEKAAGFYDVLASIEDREQYQKDALARIEAVPNWANLPLLKDFHARVEGGGILSTKQEEVIAKFQEKKEPAAAPKVDEALLERTRDLYRAARKANDAWTMDFSVNIGNTLKDGRKLSPRQQEILFDKFDKYRVPERVAKVAARWLKESARMNPREASEKLQPGDKVRISVFTGTLSNKTGVIVDSKEVKTDGKGVPTNVSGAYKPVDWSKEMAVKLDNGEIITMFKNRLQKVASLRGRLVRLAHENQTVRPHVLALLKETEGN